MSIRLVVVRWRSTVSPIVIARLVNCCVIAYSGWRFDVTDDDVYM